MDQIVLPMYGHIINIALPYIQSHPCCNG